METRRIRGRRVCFGIRRTSAACVVINAVLADVVPAATRHVPADYLTIQACINAAVSGVDECVVAPGTYHETINFLGKVITVRSSSGAAVTTIDATGIGGSVVTCSSGEGSDTVLDGFTIAGGTGTPVQVPWTRGGGLYIHASNPTVVGCTFTQNVATYGGGVWCDGGQTRLLNCTIEHNAADYGGGIYNWTPLILKDCVIAVNSAVYSGGGVRNHNADPTIERCMFYRNSVLGGGGGVSNDSGNAAIVGCTFWGNSAGSGGGAISNDDWANTEVVNCRFSGNTATYQGGAIRNSSYSRPTIRNSTVTANWAASGGAIFTVGRSHAVIVNCILWGNAPEEIVNANDYGAGAFVGFSLIAGDLPKGSVDRGDNVYSDPSFVRTPNPGADGEWDGVDDDYGDLRLRAGSPCINAGDPNFVPQPGVTDLEGHARVLCGRVDMGAYEFGIGDYDCNRAANIVDFSHWDACLSGPKDGGSADLPYPAGCEAFDFDGDGEVDLRDFRGFQIINQP